MAKRRRNFGQTIPAKDTNAYTGQCASIGLENHKKCPGVQQMSTGGTNTCPCPHHDYNKKGKKNV